MQFLFLFIGTEPPTQKHASYVRSDPNRPFLRLRCWTCQSSSCAAMAKMWLPDSGRNGLLQFQTTVTWGWYDNEGVDGQKIK